jgi:hypothetical protein
MVTSVKILALEFHCGVRNDVKMIPAILRCFPNLERLHIMVNPLMLLLEFICAIMYLHHTVNS